MTLTVADILRQNDLGLQLCAGGSGLDSAEVSGAAVLEIGQQPSGEHRSFLVLTSGALSGQNETEGALQLMHAAQSAGVAGIVLAAADEDRSLAWESLKTAAETVDFPLLTAPTGASLRGIKEAVNERVARADLRLYQRLLALQSSLISAVTAPDSTESLLRRLGSVVHSTVILYYPDGRLLAVTGDGPTEVIWQRIDKDLRGRQHFMVGQWHVVASPIRGPEDTHRWIVLAKRGTPTSDELVSPLVETVEQLLSVIAMSRRAAANEEAQQRADVLIRLVSNAGRQFGWDQVRPHGFRPHRPCYVAAIALPEWRERRLDSELHNKQLRDVLQNVRALIANSSAPHLVAAIDGVVVVLLQAPDTQPVDECVSVLRTRDLAVCGGVGRKVASLPDVVNSYRDARLALTRALSRGGAAPAVQRFEEFAIADVAISTGDEDQLQRRSLDLLAKIEGSEPILETLVVYLENHLSVNDTAQALNIHPNSVRYRIGRAEELIGGSLRELPTIVDVYLALQVAERGRKGAARIDSRPAQR
jgi:purine catabolism regulator